MKTIAIATIAAIGSGWGLSGYLNQQTAHEVDRTVDAPKQGMVVVRVPDGRVRLEGWDRNEVSVTGTVADDSDRLELTSRQGVTEVRVIPSLRSGADATNLIIRVPNGSSLDIETDGGHAEIVGVRGMVRVQSDEGNLSLDDKPMGVMARSTSGDIELTGRRTPGYVHSAKGNVRLRQGERRAEEFAREMSDRARRFARDHQDEYEAVGSQIQAIVERAMRDIDIDGHVDFDRFADGFDIDVDARVRYDREDLDALLHDLQDVFKDLESELGEGMSALGEELEVLGEEMKRKASERRR